MAIRNLQIPPGLDQLTLARQTTLVNSDPSGIIVPDLKAHPPTQKHHIIKQTLQKCIHTCYILYFFHLLLYFLASPTCYLLLCTHFPLSLSIFGTFICWPLSTVFVFSSDFPYFFGWEGRRYLSPPVGKTAKTYNHKVGKEHDVRTEALIFHFLSVNVRECDFREDGWRARKGKEDNDKLNASFSAGVLTSKVTKDEIKLRGSTVPASSLLCIHVKGIFNHLLLLQNVCLLLSGGYGCCNFFPPPIPSIFVIFQLIFLPFFLILCGGGAAFAQKSKGKVSGAPYQLALSSHGQSVSRIIGFSR